jgi:hypothetical protein
MGSVGDAYDNAVGERFFDTLERELLSRRRFKTQAEAKMPLFEWIEGWYNPHRCRLTASDSIVFKIHGERRTSTKTENFPRKRGRSTSALHPALANGMTEERGRRAPPRHCGISLASID